MTGRLPGLRPAELDPAQRSLYDSKVASEVPWTEAGQEAPACGFTWQPTHNHPADGAACTRAAREFGQAGMADMVVLAGLYLTVCAIVNAFNVPVPVGTQPESSAP